MIILHFDLQPQFKYMNNFIYTSHQNEQMIRQMAVATVSKTGPRGSRGFCTFFTPHELNFGLSMKLSRK